MHSLQYWRASKFMTLVLSFIFATEGMCVMIMEGSRPFSSSQQREHATNYGTYGTFYPCLKIWGRSIFDQTICGYIS